MSSSPTTYTAKAIPRLPALTYDDTSSPIRTSPARPGPQPPRHHRVDRPPAVEDPAVRERMTHSRLEGRIESRCTSRLGPVCSTNGRRFVQNPCRGRRHGAAKTASQLHECVGQRRHSQGGSAGSNPVGGTERDGLWSAETQLGVRSQFLARLPPREGGSAGSISPADSTLKCALTSGNAGSGPSVLSRLSLARNGARWVSVPNTCRSIFGLLGVFRGARRQAALTSPSHSTSRRASDSRVISRSTRDRRASSRDSRSARLRAGRGSAGHGRSA